MTWRLIQQEEVSIHQEGIQTLHEESSIQEKEVSDQMEAQVDVENQNVSWN